MVRVYFSFRMGQSKADVLLEKGDSLVGVRAMKPLFAIKCSDEYMVNCMAQAVKSMDFSSIQWITGAHFKPEQLNNVPKYEASVIGYEPRLLKRYL